MKIPCWQVFTFSFLIACSQPQKNTDSTFSPVDERILDKNTKFVLPPAEESVPEKVVEKDVKKKRVDATTYKEFMSWFPDLIFGEKLRKNKVLFPNIQLTTDLSIGSIPRKEEDKWVEDMYAVGKILDYKGLDIFIIEEVYLREDEETYDNHVEDRVFMMFFDHGNLICKEEDKYKSIRLFSSYHGEGGENSLTSYFLSDTTIISHYSFSLSESATGYLTPIEGEEKYHWEVDNNGDQRLLGVEYIRFSSPFFDKDYLTQLDNESDSGRKPYPEKEHKEYLSTFAGYGSLELFTSEIDICFYCEKIDGTLTTVFLIQDEDRNVLDTYIVGKEQNGQFPVKPQGVGDNWPVIETSDGDIIVNPDGSFMLAVTYTGKK